MTATIVDTGPLVAFYASRDAWHPWAQEIFHSLNPPLLTCEPVLAEACFLIARAGGDPTVTLRATQRGILRIPFSVETEAASLEQLMRRFTDTPMSLADACLVRLTELHADCRVLTLNRDFLVYRRHGRHKIPLLAPW